ncbi:MAG TPA: hypothetical protein VE089_01290 [Nitrososphaeraceae archaeon]|nr:hypothetical protein [Nitrososphaeraceae archaeon]
MSNEIEVYLDVPTIVRHYGRRKATRRNIQSSIPPMIHEWSKRKSDLAYDLGPSV